MPSSTSKVPGSGTQTLYVMISRAVSLNNLAVIRWFPSTNVNRRLSQVYRNEFDRLQKLDKETRLDFCKRKWWPNKMHAPQLP
jgi:hypothetical protein